MIKKLLAQACPILLLSAGFGFQDAPRPADLVLRNGDIVTVNAKQPRAEGVAVKEGRIVAVGSDAEVARYVGPQTKVIDLRGKFAMPGFIEGHGHFLSLGYSLMSLDLKPARSWNEIVRLVAEEAERRRPGEWIIGRGWHQSKWDQPPEPNVEGYPTHAALSRLTRENPVLLTHASGHALFANAKAMELAGIAPETPDPEGGTILKMPDGRPCGVFRETAQSLVRRVYARSRAGRSAAQRREEDLKAVELAARECLSHGVTSFQDAGSSFADVDLFKELAEGGRLKLRLWVMLNESNERLAEKMAEYRMVDFGRGHLTVRAIKRMADGALGSHGALLLEPYKDLPASNGLRVQPLEEIQQTALLAIKHGYQLCTHAIGDRVNREILDLYRNTFRSYPDQKDLRWRIEHAQHLHPADIPRFAELEVIASMQASHATSDGPFVVARLGEERAKHGAYAWRSLLDAGAIVTNGSDAPVENVDPLESFHAAVTRRMDNGETFFPEQCMTRREALESYTIDAARAAFEERQKGSLTPGKLADIVVLSENLLTCPEGRIRDAAVLYTIVGGEVMYSTE